MEAAAAIKGSSSPPLNPSKFCVYQNPTLSAALTAKSLQPSNSNYLTILSLSSASAIVLLSIISRESWFIDSLKLTNVSQPAACFFAKTIEALMGLVFLGTVFALVKVISLRGARNTDGTPSSKSTKDQTQLTNRQLWLLGTKPKVEHEPLKKHPKSKPSYSDSLVPLHQSITTTNRSPIFGTEKSGSSSPYHVPPASSHMPSVQNSPAFEQLVSTPWSNKRTSFTRKITTEENFEQFLADVDEKITGSAGKMATPPPTISSFGITSPNTLTSSANTSGTTRGTPLRPVRMSPGSQKFITPPPKKGEGDLPSSMSMEESIEAFEHMGIYPQIEHWRDRLRQWVSAVLLNPLLNKIEISHTQVMQSAAKLGISITIRPVGSDLSSTQTPIASPNDRIKEWQPAITVEEDGHLRQLHASLVQALDASTSRSPFANLQQAPQQNPLVPIIQECVDAITEHQRLQALMKGEWAKGLLPQTSVPAEYMVQRIRELAEGTCLKNFEYLGNGEVYDKVKKKWTRELPTDSHLLLYLFCAYLEHPKWMLHIDPTSYNGAQSGKNPLFLGVLPPKERLPEKCVAVISGVPSTVHPGSCILVVGKHSPPIFALYWDKKLQFSLQGRTALWDSILLLCHQIKIEYGGVVRGIQLGSPALGFLQVFDPETES